MLRGIMIGRLVWSAAAAASVLSARAPAGLLRPTRRPVSKPLEQLQRDFVDLRFGMFIHFGILTYTGAWSKPNLDIKLFNPTRPRSRPVGRRRGRRQDEVRRADHAPPRRLRAVAQQGRQLQRGAHPLAQRQGRRRARVRRRVPQPAACCPASTTRSGTPPQGIAAGQITPPRLDYVKTQLTELLTNYGPIPVLVMDGWSWQMGHNEVAYQEIRALVKSLQPDCLLTDHTHLADPWDVDIVSFEEPQGRVGRPPATPTRARRGRRSTPPAATTGSGRPTSAA